MENNEVKQEASTTPFQLEIGEDSKYHHQHYTELNLIGGLGKGMEGIKYTVAWLTSPLEYGERIRTAVNAHDALVATAKDTVALLGAKDNLSGYEGAMLVAARNALKLAGVKP